MYYPWFDPGEGFYMSTEPMKLIDLKKVKDLLSVSTATIYRWMDNEGFPKPLKLSANCARWKENEIVEWLQGREALSA